MNKAVTVDIGILFLLAAFLAVALGLVIWSLGSNLEVAQEDLADALDQNRQLQDKINGLNDDLGVAQAEQGRLEDEQKLLQDELGRYEYLICPDLTWEDTNWVMGLWPLSELPDFPMELWNYVEFTQWSTDLDWEPNFKLPFDPLLWDIDGEKSMVLNTWEDCIVLNPYWWNRLDASPSGSAFLSR